MASEGQPTGYDLQARVQAKALKDPDFRARLIAEPKAAIEEVLDTEFPTGIEFRVIEESAEVSYLVLPYLPPEVIDSLTEEEIQAEVVGTCSTAYGVILGTCTNTGTLWIQHQGSTG